MERSCGYYGEKNAAFQDVEPVLRRFGGSREQYRRYLEEGSRSETEKEFIVTIRRSNEGREDTLNVGSWVIGDPDFVRTVLATDRNRRIKVARYQKEGWDVSRLADVISLQSYRTC